MLIESKEGKRKERNKGRKQGEREGRRGDEKVKQERRERKVMRFPRGG